MIQTKRRIANSSGPGVRWIGITFAIFFSSLGLDRDGGTGDINTGAYDRSSGLLRTKKFSLCTIDNTFIKITARDQL
jgi:hypothetical protein